jgi:hypothetical protein
VRAGLENMAFILSVENAEEHDWESCEPHIIELVQPLIVEGLSTESIHKAEQEQRHYEQNVLVEHVDYQERILAVSFTAMEEKQVFEESKLANSVVSRASSLLTFKA